MSQRSALNNSLSSEHSTSSENCENVTVSEELPAVGLAGRAKSKRKKNVPLSLSDDKVDLTDEYPTKTKSKKTNNKTNKQTEKHQKALEKQAKREANEMNKIYKPGECMKYMNIEVHPTLLSEWYMSDVTGEASRVGTSVVATTDISDPCALLWSRTVTRKIASDGGVMKLSPARERCEHCLYIISAKTMFTRGAGTITTVGERARGLATRITLVIVGGKDNRKKRREANNQECMSDLDLDEAIIELLIEYNIDTVLVDTANELAQLIMQYTKAVAEEPYKRSKREIDEQASYYMRGDNKNCVAVDKDGNGLSRLWQQMLSVLPMSSLEIARAITARYKSPKALMEELSTEEGRTRVAELVVPRAGAPEARPRKLGPEFTRKLHILFTSEDGDQLIE